MPASFPPLMTIGKPWALLSKRTRAFREMIEANVPMRRMGDSRIDIGGVIVTLSSSLCGYLTGQTLFIDGGGYTML